MSSSVDISDNKKFHVPRRWFYALGVILFGVSSSFYLWQLLLQGELRILHQDFKMLTAERTEAVQRQLNRDVEVLYSIAAFYKGSVHVDDREFAVFTERLMARHESLLALEWSPKVELEDRGKFEKQLSEAAGHYVTISEFRSRDHVLETAGIRDRYFPVEYLTQPSHTDRRVIGFDHASDEPRRNAMLEAIDLGRPVATERLALFRLSGQETCRQGMLVVMPIYKNGANLHTVENRRENLSGFAVGVFRIGDIVDCALADLSMCNLNLRLLDIDTQQPEKRLLYSKMLNAPLADGNQSKHQETGFGESIGLEKVVTIAGRELVIQWSPTHEFFAARRSSIPETTLFAGLITTLLTAACTFLVFGRTAKIESLVRRRTSELKESRDKMEKMALYDSLTGLLNRHSFSVELEREWELSAGLEKPLSCAIIDADFFKHINDTYGHAVGDRVLEEMGSLLKRTTRVTDRVCRYGGEEFCVLLPDTDEDSALIWAERTRKKVELLTIEHEGVLVSVTASFGISSKRPGLNSTSDMLAQADEALMSAKQSGRNQVVTFKQLNSLQPEEQSQTCPILGELVASDVMSPVELTIPDCTSAEESIKLLLESNVESLPIVNKNNGLVGLVSVGDLKMQMLLSEQWPGTVKQFANRRIVTYQLDTSFSEITNFLCRGGVGTVVIVDNSDRPVGTISRRTVLDSLNQRHVTGFVRSMEFTEAVPCSVN